MKLTRTSTPTEGRWACEAYGADSSCVLYMIDDEWQQKHDFQLFMIKLGIVAAASFAAEIPLLIFFNRITGGKGQ